MSCRGPYRRFQATVLGGERRTNDLGGSFQPSQGVGGEQGKRQLVGRGGQCGNGTLVCVHVCVSGGLQVWGGERRAGATESQNVLVVELGRGSSWPLCCLFWGNHNAEAREGCEQQICWTDRALEGRTGSLEMTQFSFRTVRHMLCDCG